jgi:aquaporin Z
MKSYLTEFIGTFFLIFTIGLSVTQQLPLAALAIGSVLMVMVYMGGHISGAHYNPAVTLAVYLRGKIKAADVLPYLIAQIAAAFLAALMVWVITGRTFAPAPANTANILPALLVEFFFTFALALVILNVATSPATEGNSYYGLAIGFTITAAAFAGGGISGGAYNPAVAIGPAIVDAMHGGTAIKFIWIYLIAPPAGAALAAAVYCFQHPRPPQEAAEEITT